MSSREQARAEIAGQIEHTLDVLRQLVSASMIEQYCCSQRFRTPADSQRYDQLKDAYHRRFLPSHIGWLEQPS